MQKISAFVTTFNNDQTLGACLASVAWADEIFVLDSYSTDRTVEIAESHGAVVRQQTFLGYGPQKQSAMEMTAHEFVLLLDADEVLSESVREEIQALQRTGFECDGYEIARWEQTFWRMPNRATRKNYYLRLFAKSKAHISDMPVHGAPKVDGKIGRLRHPFYHFGEVDIHTKVDKVNHYSTGLVADKIAKGRRPNPWIMVIYPPLFFVRSYIFKRGFMDGWAGFISSVVGAFYAFLKYAKLYEHAQFERFGDELMPEEAPPMRTPRELHDRAV
ncbi:MAG: glycosyltransferase family 2 protein [Gammaproteobacteria bacterium]|nr:glycosyltransferase family 2 protein [Gammaproteobacteria bacterium]